MVSWRVALVREDAPDHMIWTVAVVPPSVVTDHHHRHSLGLVLVEVPVIEIAVVIAHAMHFRLLLTLSLSLHQQVEELGAILVVVQVNCVRRIKRNIRIIKEGKSWSHILLRFRV